MTERIWIRGGVRVTGPDALANEYVRAADHDAAIARLRKQLEDLKAFDAEDAPITFCDRCAAPVTWLNVVDPSVLTEIGRQRLTNGAVWTCLHCEPIAVRPADHSTEVQP